MSPSLSISVLQMYNGIIGYISANSELLAVEHIKGSLYV